MKNVNAKVASVRGFELPEFHVVIPVGTLSYELEKNLLPVTEKMNATPLKVSKALWDANVAEARLDVEVLNETCRKITGEPDFRPNAAADCKREFLEKRGLGIKRRTPSGEPAMDQETLQVYQNEGDELAGTVIDAREAIAKLSQLKAWEPYAVAGEVQTKWNQFGQPHGRYTSEDPNLQNRIVPIRETITAEEGNSFISCDLGAAEYVTWASLSGDAILTNAFLEKRDIHTETGEYILKAAPGLQMHGMTPRELGKLFNFAILYRMLPFTLSKRLGISDVETGKLLDFVKDRAPVASNYIGKVLETAKKRGFVETAWGRRRYCPELRTARGSKLHAAEKTAWHHHNAGTAAEILKLKQWEVEKFLEDSGFGAKGVVIALQMHDELVVRCSNELVDEVKESMVKIFHAEVKGFCLFKVDCRVGENWKDISK